jgi:predicted DNA-binding transcriptional regulator AlpA
MSITVDETLWDVRECAKRLKISTRTLHKFTQPHGNLPRVLIGTRVLYRPSDVAAWLESRVVKSGQHDLSEAVHDA